MLRSIFAATAIMTLAVTPATAAPCRDGKGKFVKCADAAPAQPVKCKDAKGKFAKCGTPGAKPIK
ncbi:hypothetical protein [Sphingomonas pituitosa]|uniref:hypothetical protein n=1 Tax=Sphingomonas pituitosa TaxID=99597 RepID=UPI00082C46D7|nr:hypothetical protein [Sphingomonas pituitosa]